MAQQFKTIGMIGRVKNPGVIETLKAVIQYLTQLDLTLIIESETALILGETSLTCFPREELGKHCQLLIVIGGDGSLLHAAPIAVCHGIPILGINRGRLGFLTDIHPTELDKVKAIIEGDYWLEKRFLLTANLEHHGEKLGSNDALNEVALIPDMTPHMYEFEIFINDQFVCSQNSDGVIVATPTGSTAYALSGGGPILHPQLDAIVLVPMFPHTLTLRPIVIAGNNTIRIVITPNNVASPRLTCDGQAFINTPPGSHITIFKKPQQLHLIHPRAYNYYETLRSKLHWGHKLQYME